MPWTKRSERYVSDHRILKVREDLYLAPDGVERDYVVIDCPDWVNVVPITADGEVVLIKQYRHGVESHTLEIPGGIIDPGEDPRVAARRELREETGFDGAVELLGEVVPNPAFQNNRMFCFVARDVRLDGAPQPDPTEEIEVVTVPLDRVPELIANQRISHSLVVVAFSFLAQSGR